MRNGYIKGLQVDATKYYKEEAERMDKKFDTDATVTGGVVRWNSNNNIPSRDILEFWQYFNKDFDFDKTLEVSEQETANFFKQYRESQANKVYSEEEKFEMRAAFGEGATVVNVITGKKTKL
jgi:hypothetical protein